jgi:TonB family protein
VGDTIEVRCFHKRFGNVPFTLVLAMNRRTVLFLAVLLFQTATAHADSVKDALKHQYKNHILALRFPFTPGHDQEFDFTGHRLNAPPNSAWLLYGGIYVEKLNVSSDALRLQGPLAAFADQKIDGQHVLVRFSKSHQIEIHLDKPLKSLEDAQAVLGRVFFLAADAAEHAKPELRRAADTIPDDQIYDYHQDGVHAPRPTYTPEPDFSEEARHQKVQGSVILSVVVDKMGTVARIRMDKVLGHGLDEHAMEAIKTWRFTPGTRNGEPVAVKEPIEVAFNLY